MKFVKIFRDVACVEKLRTYISMDNELPAYTVHRGDMVLTLPVKIRNTSRSLYLRASKQDLKLSRTLLASLRFIE